MKYFKPSEFACYEKLSPDLLARLDRAREIAGVPFVVTSDYRTPAQNVAAHGSVNSSHLRGLAVDIACHSALDRYSIIFGALAAGFTRIGIGRTFVHLDVDSSLPNPRIWNY